MVMGRGRIIPTTSWETYLSGILDWFGVEDKYLKDIIPNVENFPKWDQYKLFKCTLKD